MSAIYQNGTWYGVSTIGGGGGYAPIGTIISYMGTTAPQDYLICDGSVYNISAYPQLADFFATQFGQINYFGGDGTTTFAVPDLRGEFLRGTGTNSHTNQGNGASVGVHQDSTALPDYNVLSSGTIIFRHSSDINNYIRNGDKAYKVSTSGTLNNKQVTGTDSTTGETWEVRSVRPTNTSVLYCIKAVVEGDVYSTDERVVGTWIDGKKIYQKTVLCDYPDTALTPTFTNVGASIDTVINIVLYWTSNGENYTLTNAVLCNTPFLIDPVTNKEGITKIDVYTNKSSSNPNSIRINSGGNMIIGSGVKMYVTVQYTKAS